jgi:hypothetical protein
MANDNTDLAKSTRKEWETKVADSYIHYLLAESGDIGKELAREAGKLETLKAKREFADELIKRMFKNLPGKKFGVFVEKIIAKMMVGEFLGNYEEAEDVLLKFNQQYQEAANVPRTSFKAFLIRYNEIFIPVNLGRMSDEQIDIFDKRFHAGETIAHDIKAVKIPTTGEYIENVYILTEHLGDNVIVHGYSPHYEGASAWMDKIMAKNKVTGTFRITNIMNINQ